MLEEAIREAWAYAVANGYEDELRALTPFQLAVDLRDKDSEIEKFPFSKVLPAVIDFVGNKYQ